MSREFDYSVLNGCIERMASQDANASMPERLGVCMLNSLFGGGSQTTTSAPWGAQVSYLKNIFSQAQNLYNRGPLQYFPSSTVAPQNPAQLGALSGIEGAALTDPVAGKAQGFFNDLVGGKYLNTDPYQDATAKSVLSQVIPSVSSQFVQGNNMGSSAAPYAVAQGATSALAPIEYQNYQNTLDQMGRSLAFGTPGQIQDLPYNDLNQLLRAGTVSQGQSQAELSDLVNRFNFNQQAPYQALGAYKNFVGGNYGSTNTTSINTNPLSSIFGFLSQEPSSFKGDFGNIKSNVGSIFNYLGL